MTSLASAAGARTTGRLRVDGADIHYEVCGRGPAVVFAHGLGGSHISWWQQMAHFSAHHACLTFAHRGFAPSSVDAGPIDPARYAGLWYEVASFPVPFQEGCSGTRATYGLRDDGVLSVRNTWGGLVRSET